IVIIHAEIGLIAPQFHVQRSHLFIGARIVEVPFELLAGDFPFYGICWWSREVKLSPNLLRHYAKRDEHDSSHNRPDDFQAIVAVRVHGLFAFFAASESEEDITEGDLCKYERDSHYDHRSRKLSVNRAAHCVCRRYCVPGRVERRRRPEPARKNDDGNYSQDKYQCA